MAIKFVVGVPRSGKTYYSVYKIYNLYKPKVEPSKLQKMVWKVFPPEEQENFDFTYTNINQFKFDFSPKIKKLVFKELYRKLSILHRLYLDDADDEQLKQKAVELEIYNSYFVIDECHNVLDDKEDSVITWWLTYHGHLHQEIHLITQDISLVNRKYKGIAEYFYEVYPASTSLSKKSFRIGQYKSAGYHQNGKIKDIFIPFDAEVFKLYESGKAQKRGAILKKFAFIIPALFLAFILMFFFFTSSFSSSNEDKNVTSKNKEVSLNFVSIPDKQSIDFKQEKLINIDCINDTCTFNGVSVPISFLIFYIDLYPPKYHNITGYGRNYYRYSILANKQIIDLFYKETSEGIKNEETSHIIKPVF